MEETDRKVRVAGFRFHDLRHTFRTLGAEAGVPLEVMMAQLGHLDRETSLEYVHVQNRALERAKQLIESEQQEILLAAQGKGPQVVLEAGQELTPEKKPVVH
jgi:integrase